jgi:hypothetical protein
VLKRISAFNRYEMAGSWRKLYNKELHCIQSSPNIIRVIKSRRMGWAGYAACTGGKKCI